MPRSRWETIQSIMHGLDRYREITPSQVEAAIKSAYESGATIRPPHAPMFRKLEMEGQSVVSRELAIEIVVRHYDAEQAALNVLSLSNEFVGDLFDLEPSRS